MRVDTFMLSEGAAASQGKLYIHGGGITRVTAPFLPWEVPQLAFVFRIQVEPGETLGAPIRIAFFAPSGEPDGPPIELEAPDAPPPESIQGEDVFVQAAVNPGSYIFLEEGVYRFELQVGDEVLRSLNVAVLVPGDA